MVPLTYTVDYYVGVIIEDKKHVGVHYVSFPIIHL